MGEVDEHLKALADNLVTFFAANAGHKSHAAGIVFIPWMIEALRLRSPEMRFRCMHGILLNEFLECNGIAERGYTNTSRFPSMETVLLMNE
jgi:hypothetical protein